ncbi:MAG: radical SAM protein [Candidatus Bathyarchaeia archaeon]
MKTLFDLIAADITYNCNLRCPFCFNDFSKHRNTVFMKESIFRKVLDLFPLVADGQYMLSCLYEPSIHPRFIEFMEMIPRDIARKAFFTTNLTMKMSDDSFERLSRIPFHHINISLDSFKPAVFEELRKGSKFSQFMVNLEKLTDTFSRENNAPSIHYITMALKSNFGEIPDIVERCSTEFIAAAHEVRYTYPGSHRNPIGPFTLEWKKSNLLSNEEWDQLTRYAEKWPPHAKLSTPPDDYFADDGQSYSKNKNGKAPHRGIPPLVMSIDAEGVAVLVSGGDARFNLDEIERPYDFFQHHVLYQHRIPPIYSPIYQTK